MGLNGTTQLYGYIWRFYCWQKLKQECTKDMHQYKECQQVSLKEPCDIDSYLWIPKLPMSFIAMDLLGDYAKMENSKLYALTVICMQTLFVNIISTNNKNTEMVINAYIMYIYADKGRSKFILSNNGKEFSSASMAFIADQLEFTKVQTSPYSPCLNSVIERCHNFLKDSFRKLRCNLETDWDHLVHIAVMAYNVFPHTTTDESPFFLVYGWTVYLPMLHNLLQPKICYMGDECMIHLDAMREVYMLAVLTLEMSCFRYPPPLGNHHNDGIKRRFSTDK